MMTKFGFMVGVFLMVMGTFCLADEAPSGLTQAQYQELVQLSKTYKSHLAELETSLNASKSTVQKLQEENLSLTHDLSEVQAALKDEIATMKKDQDQKNFWLMIGVAGAAVFGLLGH